MDSRLWSIYRQRPELLKAPDVPNLARAICAYMRGLDIQLRTGFVRETTYVLFWGDKGAFQVLIRGEDWSKIVPLLQNDVLSPGPGPFLPWGNRVVSLANIDVFDSYYYNRVLGVLRPLFPDTYPTSYL